MSTEFCGMSREAKRVILVHLLAFCKCYVFAQRGMGNRLETLPAGVPENDRLRICFLVTQYRCAEAVCWFIGGN